MSSSRSDSHTARELCVCVVCALTICCIRDLFLKVSEHRFLSYTVFFYCILWMAVFNSCFKSRKFEVTVKGCTIYVLSLHCFLLHFASTELTKIYRWFDGGNPNKDYNYIHIQIRVMYSGRKRYRWRFVLVYSGYQYYPFKHLSFYKVQKGSNQKVILTLYLLQMR